MALIGCSLLNCWDSLGLLENSGRFELLNQLFNPGDTFCYFSTKNPSKGKRLLESRGCIFKISHEANKGEPRPYRVSLCGISDIQDMILFFSPWSEHSNPKSMVE